MAVKVHVRSDKRIVFDYVRSYFSEVNPNFLSLFAVINIVDFLAIVANFSLI